MGEVLGTDYRVVRERSFFVLVAQASRLCSTKRSERSERPPYESVHLVPVGPLASLGADKRHTGGTPVPPKQKKDCSPQDQHSGNVAGYLIVPFAIMPA
jgi:hypothetical protein